MLLIQALCVTALVIVHLFAGQLRFLDRIPRSRWLSFSGGISVAYVFIHIFPELHEAGQRLNDGSQFLRLIEHHAYLVGLGGLAVFYGLEIVVRNAQRRRAEQPGPEQGPTTTGLEIFWLHIAAFATYNGLIGYLLINREEQELSDLLFFTFAMGLHFLVNDFGLRQDHRSTYHHTGRWVLSAAVAAGWIVGLVTQISGAAVDVLFSFLAGGIILNVLKEELPGERESRFLPFLAGAAAGAALLLLA